MEPLPKEQGKISRVTTLTEEIAVQAARLIVDEGLGYGAAKARACKLVGAPARCPLPGNDQVEQQVRSYIELFCADTQPAELEALRRLALEWMDRLAEFRPHICGAVWNGTATRKSDIHLQLFCDDSKAAELFLLNQGISYESRQIEGFRGEAIAALSISCDCSALEETIGIHLMIHDYDDLRGALKPRIGGQALRGDRRALEQRLHPEPLQ